LSTTKDGGSGGGGKRTFHCPKCGSLCTNLEALVGLSRFVKCEKCQHFFVLVSDERKAMNTISNLNDRQQQNQQQQQQQAKAQVKHVPPPPPKKIYNFLDKYIVGQENAKKVCDPRLIFI
jgi:ATP-dependent Clp protease ATP-binding subunit ClpX